MDTTLTSQGQIIAPLESSFDKNLIVIVTGVQNESKINNNLSTGVLCFDFHLTNELHQQRKAMKTTQFICNPAQFGSGLLNFGLYEVLNLEVEFNISGPGIIGEETIGSAFTQLDYRCACPQVSSLQTGYLFPELGTYQVRIVADPDGQYTDCNPGDNEFILDVHVVENADYSVLSQYIAPSTLNPQPGEPVTFNLSYENSGCHGVQDIGLALVMDEELPPHWNTTAPALNNGDLNTAGPSPAWSSYLPGVHIARLFADYDDIIPESNELNNEATRAIVVGRGTDLGVAITTSDPQPATGDLISLEAEVQNLSPVTGAPASSGLLSFFYTGESGIEIPIAQRVFEVSEASAVTISVPWIVQDRNALLVARITNQDPLDINPENDEDLYRLSPLEVTLVVTDAPCDGIHPGQIEAIVSGGTPPYVIDWDNGMTGSVINVFEGTHTVFIPDARGTLIEAQAVVGSVAYPTIWYADVDGDTYGDPNSAILECNQPQGYVSNNIDCNDNNSQVHPDAQEVCNDIDDDCDDLIDEDDPSITGLTSWYPDEDEDGFAYNNNPIQSCVQPVGYILLDQDSVDCDDLNFAVNPAAQEVCNGIDDDCDGLLDDDDLDIIGQATWYQDSDGDGYGTVDISIAACQEPLGYVGNSNDCDDSNPDIYSGAPELPDGLDNDCDGLIDEGVDVMSIDVGDCELVNLGYEPAECVDLTVQISGGTEPYEIAWTTGSDTQTITVCPESTQAYSVTVTDAFDQSVVAQITVQVIDVRCGNNNNKVSICHIPPGNPGNPQNICVSINAVEDHMIEHGDYLGACQAIDPCDAEEEEQALATPPDEQPEASGIQPQPLSRSNEDSSSLSIFPNPAEDVLDIVSEYTMQRIEVYQVSGVRILTRELNSTYHTWISSHLRKEFLLCKCIMRTAPRHLKNLW